MAWFDQKIHFAAIYMLDAIKNGDTVIYPKNYENFKAAATYACDLQKGINGDIALIEQFGIKRYTKSTSRTTPRPEDTFAYRDSRDRNSASYGHTPLTYATSLGDSRLPYLEFLIDCGAKDEYLSVGGNNHHRHALLCVAHKFAEQKSSEGYVAVTTKLLQSFYAERIDGTRYTEITTLGGDTALQIVANAMAIKPLDGKMLRLLCQYGADPNPVLTKLIAAAGSKEQNIRGIITLLSKECGIEPAQQSQTIESKDPEPKLPAKTKITAATLQAAIVAAHTKGWSDVFNDLLGLLKEHGHNVDISLPRQTFEKKRTDETKKMSMEQRVALRIEKKSSADFELKETKSGTIKQAIKDIIENKIHPDFSKRISAELVFKKIPTEKRSVLLQCAKDVTKIIVDASKAEPKQFITAEELSLALCYVLLVEGNIPESEISPYENDLSRFLENFHQLCDVIKATNGYDALITSGYYSFPILEAHKALNKKLRPEILKHKLWQKFPATQALCVEHAEDKEQPAEDPKALERAKGEFKESGLADALDLTAGLKRLFEKETTDKGKRWQRVVMVTEICTAAEGVQPKSCEYVSATQYLELAAEKIRANRLTRTFKKNKFRHRFILAFKKLVELDEAVKAAKDEAGKEIARNAAIKKHIEEAAKFFTARDQGHYAFWKEWQAYRKELARIQREMDAVAEDQDEEKEVKSADKETKERKVEAAHSAVASPAQAVSVAAASTPAAASASATKPAAPRVEHKEEKAEPWLTHRLIDALDKDKRKVDEKAFRQAFHQIIRIETNLDHVKRNLGFPRYQDIDKKVNPKDRPNHIDDRGDPHVPFTVLMHYAAAGETEYVRQLLEEEGFEDTTANHANQYALSLAVSCGHISIVRLLAEAGTLKKWEVASTSILNKRARPYFQRAQLLNIALRLKDGNWDMIRELIKLGVPDIATYEDPKTCFMSIIQDITQKNYRDEAAVAMLKHLAEKFGSSVVKTTDGRSVPYFEITVNGETPLVYAATRKDWELVKILIDLGLTDSVADHFNKNVLRYAVDAAEPDLDLISKLIERSKKCMVKTTRRGEVQVPYFELRDSDAKVSETVLTSAAKAGNWEIVEILLAAGAAETTTLAYTKPALFYAVEAQKYKIVSLLAKASAGKKFLAGQNTFKTYFELTAQPSKEKIPHLSTELISALDLAAARLDWRMVQLLIECGADIAFPNAEESPLTRVFNLDAKNVSPALRDPNEIYKTTVALCEAAGIAPKNKKGLPKFDELKLTPAQTQGKEHKEIKQKPLAARKDLAVYLTEAIFGAVRCGTIDTIKYLARCLIDLCKVNINDILLKKPGLSLSLDNKGVSLLYAAANMGIMPDDSCTKPKAQLAKIAVIEVLEGIAREQKLPLKVDRVTPNDEEAVADDRGETELLCAVRNKRFLIAKKLIQLGADVNKTDLKKRSVLYWAAHHGDVEFLRYLLATGKVQNQNNAAEDGMTPLHAAVYNNCRPEVCTLLIQLGCNINKFDADEHSPLRTAIEKQRADLIIALLNAANNSNYPPDSFTLTWALRVIISLDTWEWKLRKPVIQRLLREIPKLEDDYQTTFSFNTTIKHNWVGTISEVFAAEIARRKDKKEKLDQAYGDSRKGIKKEMDDREKDLTQQKKEAGLARQREEAVKRGQQRLAKSMKLEDKELVEQKSKSGEEFLLDPASAIVSHVEDRAQTINSNLFNKSLIAVIKKELLDVKKFKEQKGKLTSEDKLRILAPNFVRLLDILEQYRKFLVPITAYYPAHTPLLFLVQIEDPEVRALALEVFFRKTRTRGTQLEMLKRYSPQWDQVKAVLEPNFENQQQRHLLDVPCFFDSWLYTFGTPKEQAECDIFTKIIFEHLFAREKNDELNAINWLLYAIIKTPSNEFAHLLKGLLHSTVDETKDSPAAEIKTAISPSAASESKSADAVTLEDEAKLNPRDQDTLRALYSQLPLLEEVYLQLLHLYEKAKKKQEEDFSNSKTNLPRFPYEYAKLTVRATEFNALRWATEGSFDELRKLLDEAKTAKVTPEARTSEDKEAAKPKAALAETKEAVAETKAQTHDKNQFDINQCEAITKKTLLHAIVFTLVTQGPEFNDKGVLRSIIALKANVNAVDNRGYSALDLAIERGRNDLVAEILKGACDEKTLKNALRKALFCAPRDPRVSVFKNYAEIIQSIVQKLPTRALETFSNEFQTRKSKRQMPFEAETGNDLIIFTILKDPECDISKWLHLTIDVSPQGEVDIAILPLGAEAALQVGKYSASPLSGVADTLARASLPPAARQARPEVKEQSAAPVVPPVEFGVDGIPSPFHSYGIPYFIP